MVNNLEIPNDAIRIRIVPNSNSREDQKIKLEVKNSLEKEMYGFGLLGQFL